MSPRFPADAIKCCPVICYVKSFGKLYGLTLLECTVLCRPHRLLYSRRHKYHSCTSTTAACIELCPGSHDKAPGGRSCACCSSHMELLQACVHSSHHLRAPPCTLSCGPVMPKVCAAAQSSRSGRCSLPSQTVLKHKDTASNSACYRMHHHAADLAGLCSAQHTLSILHT